MGSAGSRHVTATAIGIAAGSAGFGLLLLAGYLVSQRLWPDSVAALVAVSTLFGVFGLYAGWILGMLVFSSVRGPDGGDSRPTL